MDNPQNPNPNPSDPNNNQSANQPPSNPPTNPPAKTPTSPPSPQQGQPDPNAYLTEKTSPEDLSATWRRTKCLNCGYVYEGTKTLEKCPKCGNTDPDKFQESD